MNLFWRISELLLGDFGLVFNRDEEVETVSAQLIRELEEDLGVAKRYAASILAIERCLSHQVKQFSEELHLWDQRADEALGAGEATRARQALTRKQELSDLLILLQTDHSTSLLAVERVKGTLQAFEDGLIQLRHKRLSVLAWHRAVLARQQLRKRLTAGDGGADALDAKLAQLSQEFAQFEGELRSEAAPEELLPDAP